MRRSTVALVILGAFVVGVVGALILRQTQQASTGTVLTPTAGDADGDGIGDELDYFPHDPVQ